jgi:hypothetical protein
VAKQDPNSLERYAHSPVHSHAKAIASKGAALGWGQDLWQVVHSTVTHMHGPEEVAYDTGELIVQCLVRDGRPYLRSFVEHYSVMGVKHLIFLDNGSTDGTVEALKQYDNVTVLHSGLPFKTYKSAMRRYLIERFGQGRWSLWVDIDELFDYPYSDIISLDSLLSYLNRNSYTAVVAQMLDMFPEKPLSGGEGSLNEPLKELHRFYDISNLEVKSIVEHRRCPPDNTYVSDEIETYNAGIRGTVFGFDGILTKHPLLFLDGEVRPLEPGLHWCSNARVADFTCVLYHYKFLDEHFHKLAVRAVQEQHYAKNSYSYKKYLEVLEKNPNLQLKRETSREISSVNDLLKNRFLVASEDYVSWVDAEEERNLREASQREQSVLVDAFLESRRQERVNTLRIGRLEQQLREHERQKQAKVRRFRKLEQQISDRDQTIHSLKKQLHDRDQD